MSEHQKENALRIAAYMANRLSPEEREAFKRDVSEDDELRLQYVDALMNRAATGSDAGGTAEPVVRGEEIGGAGETLAGGEEIGGAGVLADTDAAGTGGSEEVVGEAGVGEREEVGEVGEVHEEVGEEREAEGVHGNWESLGEQGAREAWEAGWSVGREEARRGFLGSGWMVGLAVILLAIAGVVIFTLIRHEGYWNNTAAATAADSGEANRGNGMDSAARKADARQVAAAGNGVSGGAAVAGGKVGLADSLYARLYKPYMRGDDPLAVREYYQDYRTGNYAAVLTGGDSVVMKIPAQRLLVRDYMRLYMGLSYLASGDGPNAVRELEGVVLRTKPGDILYETARWYLALAWLKRNDVDAAEAQGNALRLAREIANSYSRYQEGARELVKALGS
jgi:hypothetical protein